MTNSNYRKGVRKEYKVCKSLRERAGYDIVQRSAGSHSPIDIWAINIAKRQILLIQCKPDGYSDSKYDKYKKILNGEFKVRFQIR